MKLRITTNTKEETDKIDSVLKWQEKSIDGEMKKPQVRMGGWLARRVGMIMMFHMVHIVTGEKTIELNIIFTGSNMIKQDAILDKVKQFVRDNAPNVKIEVVEDGKTN